MFVVLTGSNILAQNTKSKYSLVNKIHLPGDGGWDYLSVDETTGRLFVSHGSVVQVVDLKTSQLAGTINETPGVHGIAIAQDLNKAFISVGRNASVKVVDLKTLASIADVKITGENPDAIMYDQFSKKVFVFNGRTSNATMAGARTLAIDTRSHHIYAPTAEFNTAPEATADNPRPRHVPIFINPKRS